MDHEAPRVTKIPSLGSDVQREEHDDPMDVVDPMEPVEPTNRPIDAPLAKRKPAWLQETLQEVEKHVAPSSLFRESRRPQIFLS